MEHCFVLTLLLIYTTTPTFSFPSGAPQSACVTLAPDAIRHGAPAQATDVPYLLNLSALYNPALERMVYTPNTVYNGKI